MNLGRLPRVLTTDDPTALSVPSNTSPVTWHVIFWVLLCLAINSMAQPSSKICGIPSRYRIYLASSPIICVTDAAFTLTRLTTTISTLPVSFRKAAQLVVHARSDSKPSGEEAHQDPPEARTWPRWMFFIMGPLPAAIKLASFSGTPWTKTWGFMFVSSFVVTELIATIARSSTSPENTTVESILGFSALEWEDSKNASLRAKVAEVSQYLRNFEMTFFILSFIAHIVILAWAVEHLWFPFAIFVDSYTLAHEILTFIKLAISLSFLISSFVWVFTWCCIRQIDKTHFLSRIWIITFKVMISSFFFPGSESRVQRPRAPGERGSAIPPPPSWSQRASHASSIWLYLFAIGWVCHWILSKICDRWPVVAKVLLLDVRPVRPGATREEEEKERSAAAGEGSRSGIIHESAWVSFCFFLMNLGTCVFWYAFMYDESGTVNPAWTDVFG